MKCIFDLLVKKDDEDPEFDKRILSWYNIVMLSVSMLFIFSCLKTLINAFKVLFWELKENDPNYDINPDLILGTSVLLLSLTYIIAPWVVLHSEPRIWMILFSICVIIHIGQFFHPIKWVVFITSGVTGITAALSSTAQAYYINVNSYYSTIVKNSEVFWGIMQGSMLIGNYFTYIIFRQEELHIPLQQEEIFYVFLLILASLGFIFVMFLGQPTGCSDEFYELPWLLVLKVVQLCFTKDILLLTITFAYNGIEDTFMSGVYSNVIGFSKCLNEKNALRNAALSGLIMGIGTITGILIFGFFKIFKYKKHYKMFSLGAFFHLISYILMLLNLPNEAILQPTDKEGLVMCNMSVALLCGFLLGLGDYCIYSEIYGLLIEKYGNQFTTAIFLQFLFTKLCSSIAYFYNSTQLYIVVGILLAMVIFATIAFYVTERNARKEMLDELDAPRRDSRY